MSGAPATVRHGRIKQSSGTGSCTGKFAQKTYAAQETCAMCLQQRYSTGEPGKGQGRDRVGIVEDSCGYRARGVSISGKIRFIETPEVQDEGDRHVTKRSSDPRVAYPEVKVQIRNQVRVVGIVAPLPNGGSVL